MRYTETEMAAVMAVAVTGIVYAVYVWIRDLIKPPAQEPEDSDFHPW